MRILCAALLAVLALGADRPEAAAPFLATKAAFVFDHADPYPAVRMLEVARDAEGHVQGQLTSEWYGTIPMDGAAVSADGKTLSFETRNINAPEKTRAWTATATPGGIKLTGGIWHAHLDQTGRPATAAEVMRLTFHPTVLPPFRALAPDGQAKTPPMGWSSWNKFADHIDDRTIRAQADAMVSSGLRDAGYRYINIDDGWQGTRASDGSIRPNARFPDMKALADYVHARGLKLGIYSSPGPRTCAGYEGSYGHVAQDAKTFAAWGIDYLKYDLCSGEWFYADRDTVMRTYAEMGAALRATGRPIVYSLCEYGRFDVGNWGRSVGGQLWRTTGDITDTYKDMAKNGFDHNGKASDAGPGGWNDPDMLEVGNGGMSDDEYRTHMTLWAMSAAPLLMGHDLRLTDAATKRILANRAVIAIDQDVRGIQAQAARKDGDAEIWVKPLADGRRAIALFNRGAAAVSMDVSPPDVGMSRFTTLRDLWNARELVQTTRHLLVPAHGTVLLVASGA
ncbi:glycoside hydrolase family 27 protein [Nostoc sp. 3335mG]|nr:glycoside hydrolase family 27 protein [Nostoc sp. 3335mG]